MSASEVGALAERISTSTTSSSSTSPRIAASAQARSPGPQRHDVDLLRGVLHVRRALKDVNGHLESARRRRTPTWTVALPGFLKQMLTEHLASSSGGPEAYLFTMKGGGPLRMGLVYGRYFKRAVAGYMLRRPPAHRRGRARAPFSRSAAHVRGSQHRRGCPSEVDRRSARPFVHHDHAGPLWASVPVRGGGARGGAGRGVRGTRSGRDVQCRGGPCG